MYPAQKFGVALTFFKAEAHLIILLRTAIITGLVHHW
jgi:hypothetical protein